MKYENRYPSLDCIFLSSHQSWFCTTHSSFVTLTQFSRTWNYQSFIFSPISGESCGNRMVIIFTFQNQHHCHQHFTFHNFKRKLRKGGSASVSNNFLISQFSQFRQDIFELFTVSEGY